MATPTEENPYFTTRGVSSPTPWISATEWAESGFDDHGPETDYGLRWGPNRDIRLSYSPYQEPESGATSRSPRDGLPKAITAGVAACALAGRWTLAAYSAATRRGTRRRSHCSGEPDRGRLYAHDPTSNRYTLLSADTTGDLVEDAGNTFLDRYPVYTHTLGDVLVYFTESLRASHDTQCPADQAFGELLNRLEEEKAITDPSPAGPLPDDSTPS